ncbi:RNA 2',3'-cyclic phosphodiesterase [Sulfurimonas sp. HSL3-2]|uniref:RNA 2',3'-cyclic phosphodiesterase n=1 Tax=Hydrocurvibacter mobilis TaxID=3131936 RepID=UPI0031F768E7
MKFRVKQGDLVQEKATFIVNASNTELSLGSGVSRAFYEHCGGSEYQQELYALKHKAGTLKQGDVVLSSPGTATNFLYALHVAVMNYSDSSISPMPSYEHIQTALNKMIEILKERVETEQIKDPKLVIPLLGCGVGGLEKEKVFLMIQESFLKADLEMDVVVFVHSQEDYRHFKELTHKKPLFLAMKAKLYDYDRLQEDFSGLINGRWIPSENLHVTVAFFGDKFTEEELIERLSLLLAPIAPFKLSGLDYFGSNKILYAKGESLELASLVSSLNDAFSLGEAKQFIPHVTLMRGKSLKDIAAFDKMLQAYKEKEVGTVETVFELMQSTRRHDGASYECIKRFE